MISRSGVCGLNFTKRSSLVSGAQPSRLLFGASRAEPERGWVCQLKTAAVEDASGGTPLAATRTVALPISNRFRRQLDNFRKRCARAKIYKTFQFFHERFAAAHVVEARRVGLVVGNQFNL